MSMCTVALIGGTVCLSVIRKTGQGVRARHKNNTRTTREQLYIVTIREQPRKNRKRRGNGKGTPRDTKPTRRPRQTQREAAGGGKRKAKAAHEPGRQEKRSKSRKNTQAEPTPAGYKPATGRAVTTRGAQQEPPKHTQSRKCEVSPRLTPSTPPAARRDSACTVVLGISGDPAFPLGGLETSALQCLLVRSSLL